jgi:hypothetical protein
MTVSLKQLILKKMGEKALVFLWRYRSSLSKPSVHSWRLDGGVGGNQSLSGLQHSAPPSLKNLLAGIEIDSLDIQHIA